MELRRKQLNAHCRSTKRSTSSKIEADCRSQNIFPKGILCEELDETMAHRINGRPRAVQYQHTL